MSTKWIARATDWAAAGVYSLCIADWGTNAWWMSITASRRHGTAQLAIDLIRSGECAESDLVQLNCAALPRSQLICLMGWERLRPIELTTDLTSGTTHDLNFGDNILWGTIALLPRGEPEPVFPFTITRSKCTNRYILELCSDAAAKVMFCGIAQQAYRARICKRIWRLSLHLT